MNKKTSNGYDSFHLSNVDQREIEPTPETKSDKIDDDSVQILTPNTPNETPQNTTTTQKQHNITKTQHNTTQHHTTQHNTTQHNTTQHNITQRNTTQHNATQH